MYCLCYKPRAESGAVDWCVTQEQGCDAATNNRADQRLATEQRYDDCGARPEPRWLQCGCAGRVHEVWCDVNRAASSTGVVMHREPCKEKTDQWRGAAAAVLTWWGSGGWVDLIDRRTEEISGDRGSTNHSDFAQLLDGEEKEILCISAYSDYKR